MDITVKRGARTGEIAAPASKSQAHRLLICAALGENESALRLGARSNDIDATINCLKALGADFSFEGGEVRISPVSRVPEGRVRLNCGESGSTLRFLLPVVGALGADAVFVMEGRLPLRPMDALTGELTARGMNIRKQDELLFCSGRLRPGEYELPGNVSSQYVSGLLFALPLTEGLSTLTVNGPLESAAYVDMTLAALSKSGIKITQNGNTYRIPGSQKYRSPARSCVEADWSNAAFFLCMGALSEGGVTVTGLDPASAQGDRAILDILRSFGADVCVQNDKVRVRKASLRAQTVDARAIPDLVPAIACVAALAEGQTRIVNAARLRLKESDRLKTTAAMLNSLGADVSETEDGLIINGKPALGGGSIGSFNDHRIAMAAALAAGGCARDVHISGAQCVNKSFPGFFGELDKLSVEDATEPAEAVK